MKFCCIIDLRICKSSFLGNCITIELEYSLGLLQKNDACVLCIGQQTRMTNQIEEKQTKDSLERNEHILSILYASSFKLDPIGW